MTEGSEGADASEPKSEGAKAGQGKAKICIGAPSGFRHEFHLGANDVSVLFFLFLFFLFFFFDLLCPCPFFLLLRHTLGRITD